MISKLPDFQQDLEVPQKIVRSHLQVIKNPVKQQVIQIKTFTQFKTELISIEQKIKDLKTKRYCSKQNQWINLNHEIDSILRSLKLKNLRKILERKFEEQLQMLHDFYRSKYRRSIFQFFFLCCPDFITKNFKVYKFIDQVFEKTIRQVQKTQRNIYFYVNLLYIKLFTIMVDVNDRLKEEFNKKMVQVMAIQLKEKKITQLRKNEVRIVQKINDFFVMEDKNFKNLQEQNKIVTSKMILNDNFNQIKSKKQPHEPLVTSLMKKNFYDEFKKLQDQIHTIISNDWKEIIKCEQWSSQSYYGFIQINSDPPISTYLQFKDCKLKTNHLFQQISSSSFDLRTYLIKYSKKTFAKQKYILNSLNQDSINFQLTFWLSQSDDTEKNHQNIEKFLLLAIRIGIKEKIYRTCNPIYNQLIKKCMIHNYVHMSYNQKQQSRKDVQKKQKQKSETSYRSLSQSSQQMSPQIFWWVNLGEALVKAIVEVANKKRLQKINNLAGLDNTSLKKKSFISNQQQNNPQSIERLLKRPNLNIKHYYSARQK